VIKRRKLRFSCEPESKLGTEKRGNDEEGMENITAVRRKKEKKR
jgi:hypothetical protein